MEPDLSKSERETLKAIYRLTGPRAGDGGDEAHTGALAEALGVSPGTVTATIKRLADRGLADHKPYRGVELTPPGRRAAVSAIRRHRIVERFLSDMLGYAWNEADRLAGTIEHDLPQEVEDRLFVALHRPATCPHGFPIPEPEVGDIPDMPPLYELEAGDVAVVAVPGSTDAEVVEFLATLGLRPGVRVQVREKHPFDGPIVVSVDGQDRTVSQRVAQQIYVRKDDVSERSASSVRREQSA
jgi:DtxR family Mn-dependent transcriptional regulator